MNTTPDDQPFYPILRAGIVGFGTVSPGIVASWALAGVQVKVFEPNETSLVRGQTILNAELDILVQQGVISSATAKKALNNITYVSSLARAVQNTDFALEAVSEKLEIKQTVLREMKQHAPKGTILATNTSSFTLGQLTEGLDGLEKLGLYHVGLPAHLTRYVEAGSNDAITSQRIQQFVQQIRKEPVIVDTSANRPGHVWNILQADINSAALALLHKWGEGDDEKTAAAATAINQAMHYLGVDWASTKEPVTAMNNVGQYKQNDTLRTHSKTTAPLTGQAQQAYAILQASAHHLASHLMDSGVEQSAIDRSMRFLGTRWAGTNEPLMAMAGGGTVVHGTLMHNIIPTLPTHTAQCKTEHNLALNSLPSADQRLAAVQHFLLADPAHPEQSLPKAPFAGAAAATDPVTATQTRSTALIATMRAAGILPPAQTISGSRYYQRETLKPEASVAK